MENVRVLHSKDEVSMAKWRAETEFLSVLERYGLTVLPEYRVKWWGGMISGNQVTAYHIAEHIAHGVGRGTYVDTENPPVVGS